MVPLPLFKLASLFVRQISKYGANHIKAQAHDHPRFRAFAARYGQAMHQLNMRMSVALLRDLDAERRAKERAEAPTVKTLEQTKRDDEKKREEQASSSSTSTSTSKSSSSSSDGAGARSSRSLTSVWRRKFRPLPEPKAVDLFADVVGDAFILGVAVSLILYEYWRSSQKPDANKERIEDLKKRYDELASREEELRMEREQNQHRFEVLEAALARLQDRNVDQRRDRDVRKDEAQNQDQLREVPSLNPSFRPR